MKLQVKYSIGFMSLELYCGGVMYGMGIRVEGQ